MRLLTCALLALFSGGGCTHIAPARYARPARELPETIRDAMSYPKTLLTVLGETNVSARKRYTVSRVTIARTRIVAATNTSVDLEYYRPTRPTASAPSPVVAIFPVSGDGYLLERYFARFLVRRGFAVVIARHQEEEKAKGLKDGETLNLLFRQSIVDSRRALDWIETRPELDRTRVGVLGISKGGFKAVMLTASDTRVKAAVFALTGEDIPYVLAYSQDGAWKGRGISRRRSEYLKKYNITRTEFETRLREAIQYDPKVFAPAIANDRALLILGVCDTVVPFRTGWQLRRSLGYPETVLFLGGHYTAIPYVPYIAHGAAQFFKRKL